MDQALALDPQSTEALAVKTEIAKSIAAHREAADVETWWRQLPRAFAVARHAHRDVSACGCTIDRREAPVAVVEAGTASATRWVR